MVFTRMINREPNIVPLDFHSPSIQFHTHTDHYAIGTLFMTSACCGHQGHPSKG